VDGATSWRWLPEDTSDEDGRYELIGVPPGPLLARLTKGSSDTLLEVPIDVAEGAVVPLDLRFDPARVHGVVVDEAGRSIEGAFVSIVRDPADGHWLRKEGVTAPDGQFAFDPLPAATYSVRAETEASFSEAAPVRLAAGEEREVRLVMRMGGVVRVRLEPRGFDLSSLDVRLTSEQESHPVRWKSIDPDGSLKLTGLPEGTFDLQVRQSRLGRCAQARVAIVAGEETAIDLRLEPESR
jgi:hypothetical protein